MVDQRGSASSWCGSRIEQAGQYRRVFHCKHTHRFDPSSYFHVLTRKRIDVDALGGSASLRENNVIEGLRKSCSGRDVDRVTKRCEHRLAAKADVADMTSPALMPMPYWTGSRTRSANWRFRCATFEAISAAARSACRHAFRSCNISPNSASTPSPKMVRLPTGFAYSFAGRLNKSVDEENDIEGNRCLREVVEPRIRQTCYE